MIAVGFSSFSSKTTYTQQVSFTISSTHVYKPNVVSGQPGTQLAPVPRTESAIAPFFWPPAPSANWFLTLGWGGEAFCSSKVRTSDTTEDRYAKFTRVKTRCSLL